MVRWGRKAGRRQVHTEGVRKFFGKSTLTAVVGGRGGLVVRKRE